MTPSQKEHTLTSYDSCLNENHKKEQLESNKKNSLSTKFTQQPIIWVNAISIILFHIVSISSFFIFVSQVKFLTIIWGK